MDQPTKREAETRKEEESMVSHGLDQPEEGLATSNPAAVREWLSKHHRKQLTLLDKFLLELRLGRLGATRGGSGGLSSGPSARDEEGSAAPSDSKSSTASAPVDRRLVVLQTVELMKYLMGPTSWKTAAELLNLVKAVGNELHTAGGMRREPAIGNVIRRILAAVREEAQRETSSNPTTTTEQLDTPSKLVTAAGNRLSLDSILWALPQHVRPTGSSSRSGGSSHPHHHHGDHQRQESFLLSDSADQEYPDIFYKQRPELKQTVMEAIQEILSDLEDTYKNINELATSHIQAGDVVLTCGRSRTTELFLKAAATKRNRLQGPFQVLVCGGGAEAMAANLAHAGIETILIPDSAVFAVMSRVNKVIIPAHAVLANGGLIASSGCNVVALAAHYNSVPVVCVTGIFKLCPIFPHEGQDTLNDLISPSSIMDLSEMKHVRLWDVEFVNPVRDFIKPEYINLYATNVGSFQPSFIYRLLAEYYHSDDWDLFD